MIHAFQGISEQAVGDTVELGLGLVFEVKCFSMLFPVYPALVLARVVMLHPVKCAAVVTQYIADGVLLMAHFVR